MKVKVEKEIGFNNLDIFSVVMIGHEQFYSIPAKSEDDAKKLSDIIVSAMNIHSFQVARKF